MSVSDGHPKISHGNKAPASKSGTETTKSHLKVLKISNLAKEILEAENEPFKKSKEDSVDGKTVPRLLSVSKELLEAENEPLKHVEWNKEETTCKQNFELPSIVVTSDSGNTSATVNSNSNLDVDKSKYNESFNLGDSWLQTSETSKASEAEFATPCVKNTRSNTPLPDSACMKPKIQYSIDIKPLFKTPINNLKLKPGKIISESAPRPSKYCTPMVERNFKPTSVQKLIMPKSRKKIIEEEEEDKENCESPNVFKKIVVKGRSYIILDELGKGGSSVVYHCYNLELKNERAIKRVTLNDDATVIGCIDEVKMLEKLQKCNRIIKMYDYEMIKSEKLLLVVLERGGMDLSRILKNLSNEEEHLPMHMLIFYWMEMLYAVKQIHENGIIHSDLKPSNFIKAEGGLKLIDFGIASCVQGDMTSVVRHVRVGSFNYISPEAIIQQPSNGSQEPKYKMSYKSDVWSLGCILYELVYKKTPFHHIGHVWGKLSAIVDRNHKIEYPEIDWVPERVIDTVKRCLRYDVQQRPSVADLIKEYENIYR